MKETPEEIETKNRTRSAAISNLDQSINRLRALRNEIGFDRPEKSTDATTETTVGQGLDNLALLMEHGSEKINSQHTEITELVEQIRELLF